MADNLTVARPYAKAAFEFATQSKNIPFWHNFLKALRTLVENSAIVSSSEVTSLENTVQNIAKILDGYTDKYCLNFVKLLVTNHRLNLSAEIETLFTLYVESANKVIDVDVISPVELTETQVSELGQKLEQKYASRVDIKVKIDPSLIAGLILKVGNEVIDASISSRLEKLSNTLLS